MNFKTQKAKRLLLPTVTFVIVVILSLIALYKTPVSVIDFNTYENFLDQKLFKSAEIVGDELILKTDEGKYSILKDAVDMRELLKQMPVGVGQENDYTNDIFTILFLFMILTIGLLYVNKRKVDEELENEKIKEQLKQAVPTEHLFTKKVLPSHSNITFKDVAGIDDVKEELQEIVDFLKNSQKYQDFGIKLPRGVLLVGPPGVGKTLIAKAVAGEAGVPFFYQSGASFVKIYVGMGAKRVRELFDNAKKNSPAIIFIDEIDAVGKARGGGRNDEREATLNQLLTEMDGFEDSSNIIVLAATNKIEMLDDALLRAGRFDRRVFVSLPDKNERKEIIKIYMQNKPHTIKFNDIAKMTVGFSGASLATLVNEAAINAFKRGGDKITKKDFEAVKDKVLLGKKKILSYSDEEKKIQATYQAAKALAAYWYEVDFDKIGLVVRGGLKVVDREIESKTQILAKLKVHLAGMVACEMFYDDRFSNTKEDIKEVKAIAVNMVEEYGMGDGIIATQMDSANLIDEAVEDVESFLHRARDQVKKIQKVLLEKESVTPLDIKEAVGDFL